MGSSPAKSTRVLDSWHANIKTIQSRHCVDLLMLKTPFAIVHLGATQKELKQSAHWFEEMPANCMLKLGYDHELVQKAFRGQAS